MIRKSRNILALYRIFKARPLCGGGAKMCGFGNSFNYLGILWFFSRPRSIAPCSCSCFLKGRVMKFVVALISALLFVGCVQAPELKEKEWVLFPSTPDQNLNIDEQFLKKSQKTFQQTTAQRKSNNSVF